MKKLFLFLFFAGWVMALYEHQAGVFDWSIKNMGEIDSVYFWENNFYFSIKDDENSIGAASLLNGNIEYVKEVPGRILNRKFKKEVFFYNENQNIFGVFQLKSGQVIKTINIDMETPIIGFLNFERLDAFALCSKKEVIVAANNKQIVLYKASEQEELLTITMDESKKLVVILMNNDKLLIKKFIMEKMQLEKTLEMFTLNMKFNPNKLSIVEGTVSYEDIDKTKVFSIEKEEMFYVANSVNSIVLEQSLVRFHEGDEIISFKEISTSSNNLVEKLEYSKEKTGKYDVRIFDLPFLGVKKAVVIANIQDQKLNVDIFNLETGNSPVDIMTKSLKSKAGTIKKIWINENGHILIQTSELQTIFFLKKDENALWNREDSLAYITKSHFVNFEDLETKKVNDYFESLETEGTHNSMLIIPNFIQRIKTEIDDFSTLIKGAFGNSVNQLKDLTESKDLKHALKILNKFGDNTANEILYDLKKIILVVTKLNTLYALDSKTGTILWKQSLNYLIEDMDNYEVIDFFSLESKNEDIIANKVILALFSQKYQKILFLNFSPANGDIIDEESLPVKRFYKILRIPAVRHIHNDALLILDENLSMKFYPSSLAQNYKDREKKLTLYTLNETAKTISGYKFLENNFKVVWNISLNKQEEILKFKSLSSDDKNSLLHALSGEFIGIHDDKKIIFKHINYNNFAVLTKLTMKTDNIETNVLNLYIINGATGRILFNQYVSDVNFDDPINLLVDENGVFVSYYNIKNLVYEIWVIEGYSNKMENSFTNMLEKYYFKTHPSSSSLDNFNYNSNDLDIAFLQAKYAFLLGIKEVSTFKSKREITRKNLLIITPLNQIYSLDRALLSTRRSIRPNLQNLDLSTSFESIELPPYQYILPINDLNYLSYNLQLSNLHQLHTSPTNLESTSLLLAYGRDIFSCKIAPDNAYDRLNDDFNYFYLIGTVFTVVAATMFVKNLAKKTKIFQNFNR